MTDTNAEYARPTWRRVLIDTITVKAQKLRPGDYVAEWNGDVREVRIGASVIEVRMWRYSFEREVSVAMGWDDILTVKRAKP
jgi:hypothetical protein